MQIRVQPLIAALLMSVVGSGALACPVCIDLPEATFADRVLEGEVVVLAREHAAQPFRFEVVEVVRGGSHAARVLPDIPYLISSTNRRLLAADDTKAVLLSYGPMLQVAGAAGPPRNGWNKLGVMDAEQRVVLDNILQQGNSWPYRATADVARFDFFADLLTHPDQRIRDMAYAEISRAPYTMIRTLSNPAPLQDLLQRLNSRYEIPYAPVSVLMLGLSSDADAQARVRTSFASAVEHGSYIAGAWAVAGVEIDRADAVAQIAKRLAEKTVPTDLRRDLILALTVSGTAIAEIRPVVSEVLRDEVSRAPERSGVIFQAFYKWQNWSLLDHAQTALEDPELTGASQYILESYIDEAEAAFLSNIADVSVVQKADTLSMNHSADTLPIK